MIDGRFSIVPASYLYLLRPAADSGAGAQVLLQLRQHTGYLDGHWAAAAGHIERGESAWTAAAREATEEIGIADPELEFLTTLQRTGNDLPIDERVDFFFCARAWSGEPTIREPAKCAALEWFDLDALPEPVVPHELRVLESLRDSLQTGTALPGLITIGF